MAKQLYIENLSNHIQCEGYKKRINITINSALLDLIDDVENRSELIERLLVNYISKKKNTHIILKKVQNII